METFVQTFEHYMAQGYSGSDIPNKAVYPVLLLVIDSSWKMALEEKGLTEDSTLEEVKVMLTPIHARRMAFFNTRNNGSPVALARELNSKCPTPQPGSHSAGKQPSCISSSRRLQTWVPGERPARS